ncbi:MAG: hypothetical protein AAGI23_17330 [Bacteroidota bacterium]
MLNDAIGDLQKGYTQALNNRADFTGGLWRKPCQSKDGWIDEFVTIERSKRTDFRFDTANDYAYNCFIYIHQNPVLAKMVK